jgi:hypothetical protein
MHIKQMNKLRCQAVEGRVKVNKNPGSERANKLLVKKRDLMKNHITTDWALEKLPITLLVLQFFIF